MISLRIFLIFMATATAMIALPPSAPEDQLTTPQHTKQAQRKKKRLHPAAIVAITLGATALAGLTIKAAYDNSRLKIHVQNYHKRLPERINPYRSIIIDIEIARTKEYLKREIATYEKAAPSSQERKDSVATMLNLISGYGVNGGCNSEPCYPDWPLVRTEVACACEELLNEEKLKIFAVDDQQAINSRIETGKKGTTQPPTGDVNKPSCFCNAYKIHKCKTWHVDCFAGFDPRTGKDGGHYRPCWLRHLLML